VEARLEQLPDGSQRWQVNLATDTIEAQMLELAGLGLNQPEIGRELGISASTVCRFLRKAQQEGRYAPRTRASEGSRRRRP